MFKNRMKLKVKLKIFWFSMTKEMNQNQVFLVVKPVVSPKVVKVNKALLVRGVELRQLESKFKKYKTKEKLTFNLKLLSWKLKKS